MSLMVRMSPEGCGQLVLDGESYHPRMNYTPGETVKVFVRPTGGCQFTGWSGDVPTGHEAEMPLDIQLQAGQQELVANFVQNPTHAKELVFDSDFENGNGILRYYNRASRRLVIEPQQINLSDNIWWHFKIHNITPGEFLTLELGHWPVANDCQPVFSYDGVNWQRMNGAKSPIIQRFDAPSVEIARNIPYPYSRSLALVKELAGPNASAETLAISEEGRPVPMLRFTDPAAPDDQKRIIWVMGRLHAFESHSSYYAEGLARWLNGGSAEAASLLRRFIVYITPIMDVDNVFLGGAGKEQLTWDGQRVDFNRQWGDQSHWAAIRSAKLLLEELSKHQDIAAFIDLHNPWYDGLPTWVIPSDFQEPAREFFEVWSAALETTGSGAQWKQDFIISSGNGQGIEPTDDPNLRSATLYASARLLTKREKCICITIETPHWTDGCGNLITVKSLFAYGEALGRAMENYL